MRPTVLARLNFTSTDQPDDLAHIAAKLNQAGAKVLSTYQPRQAGRMRMEVVGEISHVEAGVFEALVSAAERSSSAPVQDARNNMTHAVPATVGPAALRIVRQEAPATGGQGTPEIGRRGAPQIAGLDAPEIVGRDAPDFAGLDGPEIVDQGAPGLVDQDAPGLVGQDGPGLVGQDGPNIAGMATSIGEPDAPVLDPAVAYEVRLMPVSAATLADCTAAARRLGERIGRDVRLPVFLAGAAADPARRWRARRLLGVDRPTLADWMADEPKWAPDFGPPDGLEVGAVVVSAGPLSVRIAFVLDAPLAVAEAIAAELDGRHGALRGVHAAAAEVTANGPRADLTVHAHGPQAQVVLKCAHLPASGLATAAELVRLIAGRHGARVVAARFLAPVTADPLLHTAAWYLQLADFAPDQLLDRAAAEEPVQTSLLGGAADFVRAVATSDATPGGGSVAALAGALGAALAGMVAGLTLGRPKYGSVERDMQRVLRRSGELQQELMDLIAVDSAAFEAVMASYRLPRHTAEEAEARREAIQDALRQAIEVPLETMRRGVDVLRLARTSAELGNATAVSDAGVAAFMAQAAVQSASLNVEINVLGLRNLEEGDRYRRQSQELLREVRTLTDDVDRIVRSRIAG